MDLFLKLSFGDPVITGLAQCTAHDKRKRLDRLHLREWETVGCGGWWHGVLFIFLNCLFCIGV